MTILAAIEDAHLALRADMRPKPYVVLLDERAAVGIARALADRHTAAFGPPPRGHGKLVSGAMLFGLLIVRVPNSGGEVLVVDAHGRRHR